MKTRSWKSHKIDSFPKGLTHAFGPRMAIFPTYFFLGNIIQENIFYDILERKNAFLGYENKKLKKSKNSHFTKGFNPCFWSKNDHFSNLFFVRNIGQENVFYDILERENAFLGYENKKLKKSKNWHFSKGVNPCFWSKNWQYRPGKCLLRYSRTKKHLSRLWKQEVEKVQKFTFFQRG